MGASRPRLPVQPAKKGASSNGAPRVVRESRTFSPRGATHSCSTLQYLVGMKLSVDILADVIGAGTIRQAARVEADEAVSQGINRQHWSEPPCDLSCTPLRDSGTHVEFDAQPQVAFHRLTIPRRRPEGPAFGGVQRKAV